MPISYSPRDEFGPGRWIITDPTIDDLENMIFLAPPYEWYNMVVVGEPKTISPEWIAKHPGYSGDNYEYAVSYSIWHEDLGDMLENNDTVTDAFNYYLEGTGKEWESIWRIELVDRERPWEGSA